MIIEQYTSVRATPELIGREDILKDIHDAINSKSDKPHVFYITAPGGWGKTRLLDDVLKKLKVDEKGAWSSSKILSASRLVDLYHTYTHNEEGVIADIVEVLDHHDDNFSNYVRQYTELDHVKYDLSQILRAVTQQRARMIEAFISDFNDIGKSYDKIVLAFDTVENLVYEIDRVQDALGLADEPIGVAGWMVKSFLPKISNAVVLIAGRPESPQLEDELRKLEEAKEIKFTLIKLPTFSEPETLDYFNAVVEISQTENPQVAERLEKIPRAIRQVVYYLSEGQPFLLSLFVDYLAVTEELLPIIRTPLDTIKQQADSEIGLRREQTQFKEAIIHGFQGIRRPLDDVIQALAWTPKGMGADLLAWILKRDRPTEDEIEQARGYINTLRDLEFRLSFVKIRDIDHLVFLQDEMYSLMQTLHRSGRQRHNVKQTYELIVRFYEEKIKEQIRIVGDLQKATNRLVSSGSLKEIAEAQKAQLVTEQQKLRVARARLQSYQVEYVYYCLQVNYIKGIQEYSRAAEEAFQSNDINLWLLLRDELLKFAKPRRKDVNELGALKYIDGDIGVRWIKNSIANGQYERALLQIGQFRNLCSDLLEEGSFAALSLKVWESWSLIYSGMEFERAESILQDVLSSLDHLSDQFEPEFDKWRLKLLMAYAQDITGYLYRSRGDFAKAVEYYRKNIRLWRELRVESEHANTLNNLSWSLAEIGDFQAAMSHCDDGLDLRRKLGHRYAIALSLTTFGLIETRNGQPERARFRCEQALGIFRDLEQPRGIGLACNALAEALRRMTNVADLLTDEQSLKNLELAEQYAKEAVGIFTDRVKEPMRLAEAYIELGCVYRETARRMKSDKARMADLVTKGRDAFESAVTSAGVEFAYRGVDALVNLAWMYYYINDFDEAQKVVDTVFDMIDDRYLYTKERPPLGTEGLIPWFWVQLGKTYLLLGKMAFSKYEQANQQDNVDEVRKQLNVVGYNWTLSVAYNEKYGKDFRDILGGRKMIYKYLGPLNPDEMGWVLDGVYSAYNSYYNEVALKTFETSVNEHFGLF
ncbi:MAG: tetratricopeptide repeat protein [Chloroflexota bacterium]